MAAATLRTMADSPTEVSSDDFNVYAVRAMMIGDSIVESECEEWPLIAASIERVVPQATMISQVFPLTARLSPVCVDMWKQY